MNRSASPASFPLRCSHCDGDRTTKPSIPGIAKNAPDLPDVICGHCGGVGIEPNSWPEAALLRAYQRTDGEPGNSEADALLAEIERRGLDV